MNAARKHAQIGKFSYRIKDGDKKRVYLRCSGDKFLAYIRINMDKSELITVTRFEDNYSCQGTLQVPPGSQRDHGFLVNLREEEFSISEEIKPKAVQLYLQQQLGIDIPYTSVQKASKQY